MQVLVEACCAGLSCGSVEFETQIRSLIASRKYWPHGRRVDIKTNDILHVTLSKRGVRDDAPIEVTGDTELDIRPYRLLHSEPESLFVSGDDSNCDNDATVASVHWRLPNSQLENLWDTLVFEEDIKCKILDYAEAMLLLSQSNVDPAIVPVNRLILLHGVPGTGKTTLCKAVAQRLSIRLQHTFCRAVFVVVNSHSLFSKWFSESGKLIQRMFDQVNQLLLDDKMLVVVLVDEVESIGMCRESALARNEPSDSVRAVNALLTQLDAIARHRNALVLATSNLLNSVDKALLDRADLLVHVPLPGRTVVQRLLREALDHLKEKGLLVESTGGECGESDALTDDRMGTIVDGKLKDISCKCVGLSGRAVRRLPVRAFAAVPQYEENHSWPVHAATGRNGRRLNVNDISVSHEHWCCQNCENNGSIQCCNAAAQIGKVPKSRHVNVPHKQREQPQGLANILAQHQEEHPTQLFHQIKDKNLGSGFYDNRGHRSNSRGFRGFRGFRGKRNFRNHRGHPYHRSQKMSFKDEDNYDEEWEAFQASKSNPDFGVFGPEYGNNQLSTSERFAVPFTPKTISIHQSDITASTENSEISALVHAMVQKELESKLKQHGAITQMSGVSNASEATFTATQLAQMGLKENTQYEATSVTENPELMETETKLAATKARCESVKKARAKLLQKRKLQNSKPKTKKIPPSVPLSKDEKALIAASASIIHDGDNLEQHFNDDATCSSGHENDYLANTTEPYIKTPPHYTE